MTGSLNKVTLIGHLGRDPEVRHFQNGGRVCHLSLATSERWKKDGEQKERTEWHRVVIFNEKLVDVAEKYLSKGSLIYLEGQIETRKFTSDGIERYTTEVILRPYRSALTMLGGEQRDGHTVYPKDTPHGGPPPGADDAIPWN